MQLVAFSTIRFSAFQLSDHGFLSRHRCRFLTSDKPVALTLSHLSWANRAVISLQLRCCIVHRRRHRPKAEFFFEAKGWESLLNLQFIFLLKNPPFWDN